jgi:hypothetical protein
MLGVLRRKEQQNVYGLQGDAGGIELDMGAGQRLPEDQMPGM